MTCVYIYRLTNDSGLAPCVEEGLLSLAVCKGGQSRNGKVINTGLRYWIGNKNDVDYTNDDVYILGIYKDRFLYLAKVTKVVSMMEYYSGLSIGRYDDIYSVVNGSLTRNNKLKKEEVHIGAERQVKDLAGEYVLLSDDYIYLGRDAVLDDFISKYAPHFQETKHYDGEFAEVIVRECRKYADGRIHLPHSPLKKGGNCR